MNKRLLDIIRYKTDGKQNKFAEIVGWSPQYLAKLLRGDNFGLQPVLTLLSKFPDIDARWFLFGDGNMLCENKVFDVRHETYSRVHTIMMYDRYISVMSPEEIRQFEDVLSSKCKPHISQEDLGRWERLLAERQKSIADKVNDAISKSKK